MRRSRTHTAALCCCLLLLLSGAKSAKQKVIFDHDGGIDDFVTLLLLLSQPEDFELLAVTILDADCLAALAANTTLKTLHAVGAGHVPVAVSTLPGVNPFPDVWRWHGITVDTLPMLNLAPPSVYQQQLVSQPGQDYLADLIMAQDEPVTIVATGPLSNVAYVLEQHGEAAAAKIKEVWWMGGALKVEGNVHEPGHDTSAEWNAYWDPPALGPVWNSTVPLIMVPLDATNNVPVTTALVYAFGPQAEFKFSALAGAMWAQVVTWELDKKNAGLAYYAWDALTAACLLKPDLCERRDGLTTYAVLSGASQGRTVLAEPGTCTSADPTLSRVREVSAVMHVGADDFYTYIVKAMKR